MPHQTVKHTADIRLLVTGDNLAELFSEALAALMELIYPDVKKISPITDRQVELTAPDSTALLVDFLGQALTLAQTHKEVYSKVEFKLLNNERLSAVIAGDKVDRFEEDVKAVTYHEAEVKKNDQGQWQTTLVLDI